MTKSLWAGEERYLDTYWSTFEDPPMGGPRRLGPEGRGRILVPPRPADDALNVAGRKVGPAEIEGAAMEHEAVNQAAAIGVPDDTTGTAVVTYLILEPDVTESDGVREEVRGRIGQELGKPFRPGEMLFVDEFPKIQSGKVIRRAVQATYTGEDLGDMSSIENPEALERLEDAR